MIKRNDWGRVHSFIFIVSRIEPGEDYISVSYLLFFICWADEISLNSHTRFSALDLISKLFRVVSQSTMCWIHTQRTYNLPPAVLRPRARHSKPASFPFCISSRRNNRTTRFQFLMYHKGVPLSKVFPFHDRDVCAVGAASVITITQRVIVLPVYMYSIGNLLPPS